MMAAFDLVLISAGTTGPWRCQDCQVTHSDKDLRSTLAQERLLEKQLESLAERNQDQSRYQQLKTLVLKVAATLGRRHWLYGKLWYATP